MSPFWRRESLHEKLAREGGLGEPRGGPLDPRPPLEVGIHGLARPREWDVVLAVEADVAGDSSTFVALPDGTLLVEDGAQEVGALAGAVEPRLAPPYRAEAVRRHERIWAVAANAIDVLELDDDVEGNEIELVVRDGERTLAVDGERAFGSVRTLETLASARHGDAFVVRASRLDAALWEVRTAAL